MNLLDHLTISYQNQPRSIEIYQGDLTSLRPDEAADILIVSAFPGDYLPARHSLIGALAHKGVSVEHLAQEKEEDLRQAFACWLSKPVYSNDPGIHFSRILCFEPLTKGHPTEVVGDIFRALIPILDQMPHPARILMPLVSTGDAGETVADMLDPLVDAAVNWMKLGLPVQSLRIVEFSKLKAAELKGAFAILKRRYTRFAQRQFKYDIFLSYCHKNMAEADFLYEELLRRQSGLSIFVDRKELELGVAWQQAIFNALDDCARVVALYSPDYLASKVCADEFNIAIFRDRQTPGLLLPLYLYSANLPSYMAVRQYKDCREANRHELCCACDEILQHLEDRPCP
jgi:hypothetical protein